jgi:YebC/PmpR family DNA-binding regulatory protein
MSGHSHWATIKRKKSATDAKRGVAFSKAAKALMIAARQGGGDPDANLALRYAMTKAREVNMPRDNIERAIKKGTGELNDGTQIATLTYEAFLPGGVGIIVECVTDNRNRTGAEVRGMIEKHGGSLAGIHAVTRLFDRKGVISISADLADEDKVMEVALEAGADDVVTQHGIHEVTCRPEQFEGVMKAFEAAGISTLSAKVQPVPQVTVPLSADAAHKVLKLVTLLEEHEDINEVYANFDISDEVMAQISQE